MAVAFSSGFCPVERKHGGWTRAYGSPTSTPPRPVRPPKS